MRAGGKVLGRKLQVVISYGVKLKKYFANRVANLAKRQSTPAYFGLTGDSDRCIVATIACKVCNDAMKCKDLQRLQGGYVQRMQRCNESPCPLTTPPR